MTQRIRVVRVRAAAFADVPHHGLRSAIQSDITAYQASALALSFAYSSWLIVPLSSSALASAIWLAGDLFATSRCRLRR